jgi:hypothetical protein
MYARVLPAIGSDHGRDEPKRCGSCEADAEKARLSRCHASGGVYRGLGVGHHALHGFQHDLSGRRQSNRPGRAIYKLRSSPFLELAHLLT